MISACQKKIFCLSMQRTGTTSTGRFFSDHGYKVATWDASYKQGWSSNWFAGDFEKIFKSFKFIRCQVFEDDPWWLPGFYKILFHRFPKAKFILLERHPDKWFDSMLAHSLGRSLGNTHIHAAIYGRMNEYYDLLPNKENHYLGEIDNLLTLEELHREHYVNSYKTRNKEVKGFFSAFGQDRLFSCELEDMELWQKMGRFFDINVSPEYSIHMNAS